MDFIVWHSGAALADLRENVHCGFKCSDFHGGFLIVTLLERKDDFLAKEYKDFKLIRNGCEKLVFDFFFF